jgi:hypothetical protein
MGSKENKTNISRRDFLKLTGGIASGAAMTKVPEGWVGDMAPPPNEEIPDNGNDSNSPSSNETDSLDKSNQKNQENIKKVSDNPESGPGSLTSPEKETVKIFFKIDDPDEGDQWLGVMTRIYGDRIPPKKVIFKWKEKSGEIVSESVALDSVVGKVAKYATTAHMDLQIHKLYAEVDPEWKQEWENDNGQANLSHGPKNEQETPTTIPSPTATDTSTPSPTRTETSTIPSPTETDTSVPTITRTETPGPSPTLTDTVTPGPTPTGTETAMQTPTPTDTETPQSSPTYTGSPGSSPTPTGTNTPGPSPTTTETVPPTPTGTAVPYDEEIPLPGASDMLQEVFKVGGSIAAGVVSFYALKRKGVQRWMGDNFKAISEKEVVNKLRDYLRSK